MSVEWNSVFSLQVLNTVSLLLIYNNCSKVNRQSIKGTGDYREQGRNLLQFLALEGKTAHVSLLLQQGYFTLPQQLRSK